MNAVTGFYHGVGLAIKCISITRYAQKPPYVYQEDLNLPISDRHSAQRGTEINGLNQLIEGAD